MKIRIGNIIVAAVAIVGMLTLILGTFWSFEASYTMSNEDIQKIVSESAESSEEGATAEGVDLSKLDADVTFKVGFSLEPQILLKGIFTDNKDTVTSFLQSTVENLVGQAKGIMKNIVKAGVRLATATAIDQMKAELSEAADAAAIANSIDEAKITESVEELFKDEPDMDLVKNNLYDISLQAVEASGETLSTDQKAELQTEINSSIDEITAEYSDSEGNFNANIVVVTMMKEAGIETTNDGQALEDGDISKALTDKIVGGMDESTIKVLGIVVKVLGVLILIPILLWGLLALMALLKLIPGKGVRFGFTSFVGLCPHVLFVGLPMLLIKLAPKLLDKFSDKLGDIDLSAIMGNVSLNFHSLTYISAICSVVLIVFSIVCYRRWRKEAKLK